MPCLNDSRLPRFSCIRGNNKQFSAHSSSRSIIARLFLVTSSSQFPEDPLGRCFTWKLLGKISTPHTPHPHVPSRLQVLIVSKMMSGSMHYDRSFLSLLLAFASGTPPAVAARTRFPVPPQVAQVAQVAQAEQAEQAERVVAEGRRAAGCGEWARAVGAAVGAAPVAEAPAASEAPEASAASAAAASPSEAPAVPEAPAALPSRASLPGTSWVKQEWAEAARAERAGCARRAGSSRTASSGPARCSWETAEDSPAWARWARRWEP